jgi:histidyl-tRNA synthetase
MVWEVIIETVEGRLPSIASGGRYDNLVGLYSKSPMPAVGSSIGISRVFEMLKEKGRAKTYAAVFIAQIGKDNAEYSIGVANRMRSAGIYVDLNVTEKGISKQLDYSNSLGIRYVAIIGSKERQAGKVNLRDMQAGTEELLDVDEAIAVLKK